MLATIETGTAIIPDALRQGHNFPRKFLYNRAPMATTTRILGIDYEDALHEDALHEDASHGDALAALERGGERGHQPAPRCRRNRGLIAEFVRRAGVPLVLDTNSWCPARG